MNKLVCTVLVTYNRVDVLKNTLTYLFNQTFQPETIVVVDNCSVDGTDEYLNNLNNPKVEWIKLDRNIGYAGGISKGIEYAMSKRSYDFFWIMDDDSFPGADMLQILMSKIATSGFDIIGTNGYKINFGKRQQIVFKADVEDADIILIDAALLKAEVVHQIGSPSEKFFMMCEDYEYCKRIKKKGFKVGVLNMDAVERLHLGGDGKFTKNTLWRGYYHSRNHLLILKQYFSLPSMFAYMFMQSKFIIAAAIFAPDRLQRVKLRLLGIWHGLKGVDGKTLDPGTLKFHYSK